MRAALLQLTSSDQPLENLRVISAMIEKAAAGGAEFILTPEVSNCVSTSRLHQNEVLSLEAEDPVLIGLREAAKRHRRWLLIGSLALKTRDPDGRFANRSFLIDAAGQVVARYDKIHMFDVDISDSESYRESDGFRPGDKAVVADAPFGRIGMTVCYDLRFPELYRRLARAGANILTVPSAFSPVTGAAHWESLLRARAIETGAYVLAPAQTGDHSMQSGRARRTYGHTMAVAPWGEVLLDTGTTPGIHFVDLDISKVEQARRRVPSLMHERDFTGP